MMDLVPGAVDRPVKTTRYLGSYSLDIKLPVDGLEVPLEPGSRCPHRTGLRIPVR